MRGFTHVINKCQPCNNHVKGPLVIFHFSILPKYCNSYVWLKGVAGQEKSDDLGRAALSISQFLTQEQMVSFYSRVVGVLCDVLSTF
jgi:hypothetical protein